MSKRQKTNVHFNVQLLNTPTQILDKYKGSQKDGKILPVISNQKVNEYMKEIADLCSITKNLVFHMARHSFATTITLSNGVPIETVSKMLGQYLFPAFGTLSREEGKESFSKPRLKS